MYTLVLTCSNPAQLIGFYHQNKSPTSDLSFAKLVPCSPKESLYAWGTPKDAGKVKYIHSDAGVFIVTSKAITMLVERGAASAALASGPSSRA